jgi:hypothetical protein
VSAAIFSASADKSTGIYFTINNSTQAYIGWYNIVYSEYDDYPMLNRCCVALYFFVYVDLIGVCVCVCLNVYKKR